MKSLMAQQLVLFLVCLLALADRTRSQTENRGEDDSNQEYNNVENGAMNEPRGDDDDDDVGEDDAGGRDVERQQRRHQQLKELLKKQLTINREVDRPPKFGRNRQETEADEEGNEEEIEEENQGENEEENAQDNEEENEENSEDENEEDSEDDNEDENEDYDPYTKSFHDQQPDGSYVYGYSLPDGVRRYERSFYSGRSGGRVVEGFYTQARHYNQRVVYELRCYRSDIDGFKPLSVQYLERPPTVRRDRQPDVDCFD